ncbi:MAG: hypothetical protein PGN13_01375 [Patulibacter minatonensis]
MHNILVQVGLVLLAVGALLGWVVTLRVEYPQLIARLGVKSPRRLLQMHIDYVMMGVILIAVGLALPELADWHRSVLIFGTIVNPLLFLPLAFDESLSKSLPYRALTGASFLAMSTGTVAAAAVALGA